MHARIPPRTSVAAVAFATIACLAACSTTPDTASTSGTASGAGAGATVQPSGAPPRRTIDQTLAVATFDEAWRIVRDTHFDPELGGVDWNAVREELRPRALEARNDDELRAVLGDMLMELGLSHFAIIPRDISTAARAAERSGGSPQAARTATGPADATAEPPSPRAGDSTETNTAADATTPETDSAPSDDRSGTLGLHVRVLDESPVVTALMADGAAARAGVAPGWIVEEIDGRSTQALIRNLRGSDPGNRSGGWNEYVANAVLLDLLERGVGRSVSIAFLDGEDRRVELDLIATPRRGETVELGPLKLTSEFSVRSVEDAEVAEALAERAVGRLTPRIGLIAFSTWIVQVAEPFHRAVDAYRGADGIIVDLRGNPGGLGGLVMGIGGHFVDEPRSLGSFRSRDGTLHFRTNPRRTSADGELVAPYGGPLAILVDGMSASTSEIFAGGMQSIGRVRVFGSTTAGAALPAAMSRLPNGDTLLHAIADFILPDGSRLEGVGVVPDERIEPTRADLLAGRDPALLAAVRWIAESSSGVDRSASTTPLSNRELESTMSALVADR